MNRATPQSLQMIGKQLRSNLKLKVENRKLVQAELRIDETKIYDIGHEDIAAASKKINESKAEFEKKDKAAKIGAILGLKNNDEKIIDLESQIKEKEQGLTDAQSNEDRRAINKEIFELRLDLKVKENIRDARLEFVEGLENADEIDALCKDLSKKEEKDLREAIYTVKANIALKSSDKLKAYVRQMDMYGNSKDSVAKRDGFKSALNDLKDTGKDNAIEWISQMNGVDDVVLRALLIQDNESLEDRLKGNEGERIDAVLGEDGNELKRKSELKETGEQFRARLIRKQMDTRMLVTKDGTDKPNMKENTNMTISMLQQVKENCEDPGEKAQLERAIWMLQVAEVNYSDEMQGIVILEVLSDDVIGICNKSGLFNREGVIPEQSGVDRSGSEKKRPIAVIHQGYYGTGIKQIGV